MSNELASFEGIKEKWLKIAKEEDYLKECSFALQHFYNNPYLNKATPISKQKSVYNCALTGLTLNPVSKYAYLVPRNVKHGDKYEIECCLEPSYIGLVKLLTDSGSVKSINTQIFYEGDNIQMDLAAGYLKHNPYVLTGKAKGEMKGVYSIATLSDGSKQIELMTKEDIDGIRDRSESYKAFKAGRAKSAIWESDYREMARKTVVKRIYKHLPKTDKVSQIEEAIQLDNENNGFRPMAEFQDKTYAYSIMEHTRFQEDKERDYFEGIIDNCIYKDEIQEIIQKLESKTPKDPANMGQKELSNHLKKITQ